MKLFDDPLDSSKNWLPQDGVVHYYGVVWSVEEANDFF